jgi:myosin heavy subunit
MDHINNFKALLEKSRVVRIPQHERNFHIFYQIFTDPKLVEQFELSTPEKYCYLRKDTISVKNIDDAKDFIATKEAMKMVGISDEEQENVFRIVSGILNLGNISFEPDPSDSSGKLKVKDDIC